MTTWIQEQQLQSHNYICGFCGYSVASDKGYSDRQTSGKIVICPHCNKPTYLYHGIQVPDAVPGNEVNHLPESVEHLYKEARNCVSVQAYTSAVLSCRKLLMNIAVSQGAKEGENFFFYVDYLASNGYVPPNGRGWVDHIRQKGNEATHEIVVMQRETALELISFAEMLLKFIFEFPAKVPKV